PGIAFFKIERKCQRSNCFTTDTFKFCFLLQKSQQTPTGNIGEMVRTLNTPKSLEE
ncbi:hypothetical protein NPIL_601801, partial [Nephila pilipes]